MAVGRQYSEELLVEYAFRISQEEGKEKGGAALWFMEMTGASRGTAYRVREKLLRRDVSLGDVAQAKQRRHAKKNELELAAKRRDMLSIAAVKFQQGADKRKIPTMRAYQIARAMGYCQGEYSQSTIDRYLAANGINAAHAKDRPMSHSLRADYPFHVVAVDATPIDHYYLRLDRTVADRLNIPAGDKHLDDILRRESLSKIWVYYAVDMYSKAFLCLPFASLPKGPNSKKTGENADDYYTFLRFCFLPKADMPSPLADRPAPFRNCPIEGKPTILFCDKGSGIGGSNLIRNLCGNLGIRIVTQLPGNPSSKGIVESRIGAFKRSYESLINPKLIHNIDQLIYFYQAWTDYHNRKSGAYDRWIAGAAKNPVPHLTEQNFKDAATSHIMRVIDGYGCISIDNKAFFVTADEMWRGARVQVYRSYARDGGLRYAALLGKQVVELVAGRPEHGFEDIKTFPQSSASRAREEVKALASAVRDSQIYDDIIPHDVHETSKVHYLPVRLTDGQDRETGDIHTPLVRESFDNEESAIGWLLTQNGLFLEEIPQEYIATITNTFRLLLAETGEIAGDVVLNFSNAIAKHREQNNKELKKWKQ